jgi:(E)-4-hydroxy-3-methylbut-2-enyl-diphosphate synthase
VGIAPFSETHRSSTSFQRRRVKDASDAGVHPLGAVFIAVDDADIAEPDFVENLRLKDEEARVDALLIRQYPRSEALKARLRHAQAAGVALVTPARVARGVRLLTLEQLRQERQLQASVERFAIRFPVPPKEEAYALLLHGDEEDLNDLAALDPSYIILEAHGSLLHMGRRLAELLQAAEVDAPVIWAPSYIGAMHDLVIQASAEVGALLVDGLGEGLCLQAPLPLTQRRDLSFAVLQAARMRSTKTEFISCPSCGRTLFDLQEVTQRIKKRTEHLAGVKIAIMGCIVNGPGEMADADFGYVGSKAGMIDLYVGHDCVERNIPFAQADERLVDLIKTHGRWVEPGRSDQKGIQHR